MKIERFVNQLMSSNCYVIVDDISSHCIVIDPGSEKSEDVITYITKQNLFIDYIILTHEHSDHTWGVNVLLETYPSVKVICSAACKYELPITSQAYFRFYYQNEDYNYYVQRIDSTIEELNYILKWNDTIIDFISTPGHSRGSICIKIDDYLFSGDTVMQSKPFMNKHDSNWNDYEKSINKLLKIADNTTLVYPGHGEPFLIPNLYISPKIKLYDTFSFFI